MDNSARIMLPPPNFEGNSKNKVPVNHHYLTPSGMTLLPRGRQPPPMYGARGATVPAKYHQQNNKNYKKTQSVSHNVTPRQYCDSCDMELQPNEDIHIHKAQHEECPVDGCNFQGHPKVLDRHVMALHSSGLFEKFKKLNTPEEIAAWREERKKKYPTVANTLMKARAKEQRQRRGERLEANKNRFGKKEDCKRLNDARTQDNNGEQKWGRGRQKGKRQWKKLNPKDSPHPKRSRTDEASQIASNAAKESADSSDEDSCNGIPMFRGITQLKSYKNSKKKEPANALTSLMDMYGSDDSDYSDGNEELEECQTKHVDTESLPTDAADKTNAPVHSAIDHMDSPSTELLENGKDESTLKRTTSECSDEGPEELPIERNSKLPLQCDIKAQSESINVNNNKKPSETSAHERKRNLQKQKKRQFGLNYKKARLRKQNTMLEKLLEPEIRHERNVLLQCVRFVCENDFFNIGKSLKN